MMHAAGKAQVAGRNWDGAEGAGGEAGTRDLNRGKGRGNR